MASPTGRWVQPLRLPGLCRCSPSPPPPAHVLSSQHCVLLYLMTWCGRADGDLVTDAASVSSGHGAGPTRQPHLSSGLDVTRATPPPVNTHCIHPVLSAVLEGLMLPRSLACGTGSPRASRAWRKHCACSTCTRTAALTASAAVCCSASPCKPSRFVSAAGSTR